MAHGTITLPTYKCQRCPHDWVGKSATKPQTCPKCRSRYWDKPRKGQRRR